MSGYGEPSLHRGSTMTKERPDDAVRDVVRARSGVRNAGVSYGPRLRRRSVGDAWRDFAHRYGWRAYALPGLVVLTIAALMTTSEVAKRAGGTSPPARAEQPAQGGAQPPVASGSIALKKDDASSSGDVNNDVLKGAALPSGASYTSAGAGTFRMLKGSSPKVGTGRLFRYSIEVENGISGVDLQQFQHMVVQTLADPRSWSGHGLAVQRVDSGPIDFRVSLTTPMTVRQLCGYTIKVETSCYAPAGGASDTNRVVFNLARWVRGSTAYVGDLQAYRIYMINHEDGHAMGHMHAHQCLPGGLAPVMMQQTFGLKSATSGKLCGANPWPFPPGAKGVPGAEQPDTAQNDEYGLTD